MWAKKEGSLYSLAKMALELRPWHEGTSWETQMKLQISLTAALSTTPPPTQCGKVGSIYSAKAEDYTPHMLAHAIHTCNRTQYTDAV